jgi:hypothetical protein
MKQNRVLLIFIGWMVLSTPAFGDDHREKPGEPFTTLTAPEGYYEEEPPPPPVNLPPLQHLVVFHNFHDLSRSSFADIQLGEVTWRTVYDRYDLDRFNVMEDTWGAHKVMKVTSGARGPVTGFYVNTFSSDAIVQAILVRNFDLGARAHDNWTSLLVSLQAFGAVFDVYQTPHRYVLINEDFHIEIGLFPSMDDTDQAVGLAVEYIRFHASEPGVVSWLEEHGFEPTFVRTIVYTP